MIALFGHITLAFSLMSAILLSTSPRFQHHAARGVFILTTMSFLALICAYVLSDFSILNVVQNSHSEKPLIYKIAGAWGNHEGSMLLWVWMLALWTVLISRAPLPAPFMSRVLSAQGIITTGFLLFVIFTSNPFLRLDAPVSEGMGLNPVLQDPLLAIHPPFLYAGYVGFSIAFSFALAALWDRKIDAGFARILRPWVLAAWTALTLGIALGSFWAYYELGWGGFWFWDPVENASLLPWLAGTELLHSVAVLEKRDTLRGWTILLAILSFSFALLGTFLVRSGVLTSVHAFASDPARGIFILVLLTVFTGGALLIYALRAPEMAPGRAFPLVCRETALLLNNVFLSAFATTVFLGTLYPIFLSSLDLGSISVGAPYYNMVLLPMLLPFAFLMGAGPYLAFGGDNRQAAGGRLVFPLLLTAAVLFVIPWQPVAVLGFIAAAWISFAVLNDLFSKTERGRRWRGLPKPFYGMTLAHFGFALMIAGATGATQLGVEKILWMSAGEHVEVAGHDIAFLGAQEKPGVNYESTQGIFTAGTDYLVPEKRTYTDSGRTTSETALKRDGLGILYLVLGDADDKGRFVVRIYHHPMLILIFLGAGLMAGGGVVSAAAGGRKKI
jgi:cytochrome c-type biogenesis protein CcmF